MKVTKCDRCGKEFEPSNIVLVGDDRMRHRAIPIKLKYDLGGLYTTSRKRIDICGECMSSLWLWLDEFKNGGGSMDA